MSALDRREAIIDAAKDDARQAVDLLLDAIGRILLAHPDGTTPVTIRLTPPILTELERQAATAGQPRSTYARHLGAAVTFVSLFAGIGGFDLGLERAGFTPVGMCEIDPHARSVLDRHWPDVPKHDDVTTLTPSTFGPADVITFGSPCQDLSVAGRRAGLGGERSGLFLEAVRYIREMLEATHGRYPRVAVWENVPGAFSSNGGEDFAAVLASLVGGEVGRPAGGWAGAGVAFGPLGSAEWRVLDSQHFGVAQRRRRVFLVYHPGGERAGQVLFEPASVSGHPPTRRAPGEGITGALTGGAGSSSAGNPDDNRAQAGFLIPEVMPTMRAGGTNDSPTGGGQKPMVGVPVAFKVRGGKEGGGKGYLGSEDKALTISTVQEQYLAEPVAFVASNYSTGAYKPADNAEALTTSADRTRAAPIAFAENSRNELRLEGGDGQVTGALSTGGGKPGQGTPTIATPYAVRRLTPKECERLQAFPDDWTELGHYYEGFDRERLWNAKTRTRPKGEEAEAIVRKIADTHRYRMLGNAVTVTVASWIGDRIRAALAASEETP